MSDDEEKWCPFSEGANCSGGDYCGWHGDYFGLPFFVCANSKDGATTLMSGEMRVVIRLCGWGDPPQTDHIH